MAAYKLAKFYMEEREERRGEEREESRRFACHRLKRAHAPLPMDLHAANRPLAARSRHISGCMPTHPAGWIIDPALKRAQPASSG